jgi:hypothetical protein
MKEPKQIRTEIVINATPQTVWNILVAFDRYPEWNPFIKSIHGKAEQGAKITARIEPPGASGMTFKPTLLSVVENHRLSWLGNLFIPGLFDGEHIFELYENTDGSTTFVQREIFKGILVPLFRKMLDTSTVEGFTLMNKKLKSLAEVKTMHARAI